MRSVLIALMLMAITLPAVHAVGIATMTDYSGGFEMDEGDQIDLEFSLRGDDQVNEVKFYMYSENDGMRFNGNSLYEKEFNLDEYENEDIEIEMEAWLPGNWDVTYGYRTGGEDGSFDIEAFVENTFVVEVEDREDYDANEFDVLVDSTESESSSSGSSGGGGGGAYIPPEDPEKVYDQYGLWYDEDGTAYLEDGTEASPDYIEFLKADEAEQEVILADVSTQGSSLSEIAVDVAEAANADPIPSLPGGEDDESKFVLVAVLFLGIIAVVFTFGAAKYEGKGE